MHMYNFRFCSFIYGIYNLYLFRFVYNFLARLQFSFNFTANCRLCPKNTISREREKQWKTVMGNLYFFNFCIQQQKVPFRPKWGMIQVWVLFSGDPWGSHTCRLCPMCVTIFMSIAFYPLVFVGIFMIFYVFFSRGGGCKVFFSLLVVFCRHCSRKFVVLFFFVSQQNYLETLDCASPHRLLRSHAHKAYYAILCLLLCSWFFSSVTSGFCFVLFLLAKKERCPCGETKSTLVFG